MLTVVLISSALIFSINGFVSGESKGYSSLQRDVESIIEGNEENISVFIHTKDGEIGINEDKVYSSASTIKVPILLEALRQGEAGILNLDETVKLTSSDIVSGGGMIRHLSDNQTFSIRDLLFFMITVSDNTATNLAIERVGMESVNETCGEIGCNETKLQRYMMESVKPKDNLTTARDMGTLMKAAYEGDILNNESKEEFLRMMGEQKLATNLPVYRDKDKHKGTKFYHKGGSLGSTSVRHDVGMVTLGDEVVYVSVLTENVSKKTAHLAMAQIGERIMDYLVE